MNKATVLRVSDRPLQTTSTPILSYQVAMPCPESHLFEVTLTLSHWSNSILDLKMPVWTPGSYLIREYARQVQDFRAETEQQKPLFSYKVSKNHWQVKTGDEQKIKIFYRVFANELSVRTNHLDSTHGYFNGAALFYFIPGLEHLPIEVKIIPPQPEWKVSTALPIVEGSKNVFVAGNFDILVDSPFEIGNQDIYDFEVDDKPHQLVVWGQGNADIKRIIADTKRMIETERRLYGSLPYDRYLFILHLVANQFGGLEHKNSCSLIYPRFGFNSPDKYYRFAQLVAHEFFHLWNVKRIRPKALEVIDYEQENYTTSLWFCEGTTSYYDTLIPLWSGIYDRETFYDFLSKEISRFLSIPGRKVQSLHESSFDAWIKLYRRDANSDNSQISYYLKGEMVSLLLDLLIRAKYQNSRSLNDVMRLMWERFGRDEIGFTPTQLQEAIEGVAETDLSEFFERYLEGTEELPFDEYLRPFGLQLLPVKEKELTPFLGIKINGSDRPTIQFVEAGSPAQLAGIDAGDELLAIDGVRVMGEQLSDRLRDYRGGDLIKVTVFHDSELRTYTVELASPQVTGYQIVSSKLPSSDQKELLKGWLSGELL